MRLQGFSGDFATVLNVVRDSMLRRNACAGIRPQQAVSSSTIERNQIAGNRAAGGHHQASGSISSPGSNLARQNSIAGKARDGAYLSGFSRNNRLTANVITVNGANRVHLHGAHNNDVQGNQVRRNFGNGVVVGDNVALGTGNRITANLSLENGLGSGGFDLAEVSALCLNTWSANTFLTRNHACIS